MSSSSTRTDVRPLLVRPGARFTCFGDGLCCTDIHGLGPLTRPEAQRLRVIKKNSAGFCSDFEDLMIKTQDTGRCVFLRDNNLCDVHARFGMDAKPAGCRRFPFGLVATPQGGRITTEHRCPCRTLGDRPHLEPTAAEPSVKDDAGRLVANHRVTHVRLTKKNRIPFHKWLPIEKRIFEQFASTAEPITVLASKPFPSLRQTRWHDLGEEFASSDSSTRFDAALGWFGDAVRALRQKHHAPHRDRPWKTVFDRAQKRHDGRSSKSIFVDWLADEIWSLKWTDRPFVVARADLATRLVVAQWITKRLRRKGEHEARAAAEAVTVVELVSASEHWTRVTAKMKPRGL